MRVGGKSDPSPSLCRDKARARMSSCAGPSDSSSEYHTAHHPPDTAPVEGEEEEEEEEEEVQVWRYSNIVLYVQCIIYPTMHEARAVLLYNRPRKQQHTIV